MPKLNLKVEDGAHGEVFNLQKDQYAGYSNSLPLSLEDLYGLLKNWPKLERDIKRGQLMISLWERKKRKAKTAIDIIYRTCAIRSCGPKYATVVSLYPYQSRTGKSKMKVIILIKEYETWAQDLFMIGDQSTTLNAYEMNELKAYATKVCDQNGVTIQPIVLETKEEDEDLGVDEEVSCSEELPSLPNARAVTGGGNGGGSGGGDGGGESQNSLSQISVDDDEDDDDDFIDDDDEDDEDYVEQQFSQKSIRGKRGGGRGDRPALGEKTALHANKNGRATRVKKPP